MKNKLQKLVKASGNNIAPCRWPIPSKSQSLFRSSAAEIPTKRLILLSHLCIAWYLRPRRPDLLSLSLLAVIMLRDDLADRALEEEGRFLVLGVQLAVGKDSSVEVLLCVVAENFVFFHDARVHVADKSEVGFRGVPVSVDLVGHQGCAGALREEFLDHHEMWPACVRTSVRGLVLEENLRDNHGRRREIVSTGGVQAFRKLLRCRNAMVLDMPVFGVAVERVKIEKFRNIRVCRRAVVTFIEVVRQNLPVVVTLQLIGMVKIVVVKVIGFVPLLLVNILEVFVP